MRRLLVMIVVGWLGGCSESAPDAAAAIEPVATRCQSSADCEPGSMCLHQRCTQTDASEGPGDTSGAALSATPARLDFGPVDAAESKRLGVSLANTGSEMLTLESVTIHPKSAPFRIETLGSGPFWIRPGRSRDIFVTYAPTGAAPVDATLRIVSQAPVVEVGLSGQ